MNRVIFIKNTMILSASALILRFAGVIFKIWLSAKVGSETIGLYQIVMSVYVLAASFASSGLSTAVTRLTTEELAVSGSGVKKIMSRGVTLTAAAAFVTFLALFFGANPIAKYFIGDMRAVASLKIMAAGLIFVGLCSCLRGYFLARRSAISSSASQILEQVVRIAVIALLIKKFAAVSVSAATAAIVLGDAIAEATSSAFLYFLYLADRRKLKTKKGIATSCITKKMIGISLPITSGRYLSSLLRTTESTMVPRLFILSGMTSSAALSSFGIIKGMALPLLLFPSAVLSAVSLLLIPELSEAKAKRSTLTLKSTVFATLKITTLISLIFGCVFFFCGEKLGVLLYGDPLVGKTVKWLAPLTPLMYIDSIADGMLKGLDKQAVTFRYSVADSALRLLLIFLILPRYGFAGFIFIMYISNLFTALLNFRQLIITTKVGINFVNFLLLPAFAGITVCLINSTLLNSFSLPDLPFVILFCAVSLGLYVALLFLLGLVKKNEFF